MTEEFLTHLLDLRDTLETYLGYTPDDYYLSISPSTAKEQGIKDGDIVENITIEIEQEIKAWQWTHGKTIKTIRIDHSIGAR
jgi:anaerobic selenocysteine-containing dehydrogenase